MDSNAIVLIAVAIIGTVIGFVIKNYLVQNAIRKEELEAGQIINQAKKEAKDIEIQAKDRSIEIRQQSESEIERKRKDLNRQDDRMQKRRTDLERQSERHEGREQSLNKRQSQMDKISSDLDGRREEILERLEKVSSMTKEEARNVLMEEVEKEGRSDMARIIRNIEAEAKEEGEKKARKIISGAIQRVASEHVSETTTSRVEIPNDDMKGRIIGRNGRNIRSFEQAAGVDVVVDDTPGSVTISSFDPIRREVAKRSLEKLVLDGRIHPASIEKIVNKQREDVEKVIIEAGEQAVFDANIGNLHKEIVKMLGRLKFRTSYGQNQLAHAVETSRIAGVIAAELGADLEISKIGGLLHDIGKAMDHNMEGTHAIIGAEYVRRYGVQPIIVNAIAAHHHEVEPESVEAIIVESSDAISGARPGARRESLDQYVKRIKSLEDLANSYKGVVQSYALQAGREVRIIVKPEDIDDLEAARMAREIAKQIEETMQYPGQIKVNVMRETRSIEFAK